jgi:hypothetical protein
MVCILKSYPSYVHFNSWNNSSVIAELEVSTAIDDPNTKLSAVKSIKETLIRSLFEDSITSDNITIGNITMKGNNIENKIMFFNFLYITNQ